MLQPRGGHAWVAAGQAVGRTLHAGERPRAVQNMASKRCHEPMPQAVDLSRPGLPAVQRVLGWHPLHVAAMSGAQPCLPRCSGGPAVLDAQPLSACTVPRRWLPDVTPSCLPACLICHAGNVELVKLLVQQHNCDLRVKSMNSWTPLHYAAAFNQVRPPAQVARMLLPLGCLLHSWPCSTAFAAHARPYPHASPACGTRPAALVLPAGGHNTGACLAGLRGCGPGCCGVHAHPRSGGGGTPGGDTGACAAGVQLAG